MKALITGAAGFIGTNLAEYLLERNERVVGYDRLTYAGKESRIRALERNEGFKFVEGTVTNFGALRDAIERYEIDQVFHLAAETHVDRSISEPMRFVQANALGTFVVLEVARCCGVPVHYVTTDEVFGALGPTGRFDENSPLNPSTPYAATKAAGNLFCTAYRETYGMRITATSCSNNYGPWQHHEKLIPKIIKSVLDEKPFTVHGDGKYVRDWLYVKDHCEAIVKAAATAGNEWFYCVGGDCELTVLEVHEFIAGVVHELTSIEPLPVEFVTDRQGNDRRYSIDHSRITNLLGWRPGTDWRWSMRGTVVWYLQNEALWRS